jgi:para-nitrobenzyl esterase
MLGSNSADTAGNRIRASSKEQLWAHFGQWSAEAKAAYDPDGTKSLATMVSEANDDFGQAEPARFAASEFATNGSPVYLYRFSYVQTDMRQMLRAGTPHGGEIGFVFGTLGAGGFGPPPPPATDEDRAVSKMAQGYWVNFAKTGNPNGAGLPTWPRYDPGKGLIFEFHPDGTAGAIPDPWKPRLDVMHKATESGKRADF